jgi:hypothetical protein
MSSYFLSVIVLNVTMIFYRQEEEADNIQLIAARAVNTSTSAYDLVRDALSQQQNIRYCKHVLIALLGNCLIYQSANFEFPSN